MTDFVLEQNDKMPTFGEELVKDSSAKNAFYKTLKYAKFLKQPLTLGMFVPCDEDGNILEEPEKYGWLQNVGSMNSYITEQEYIDCEKFHLAKERVLFEGYYTDIHNIKSPSGKYLDINRLKYKTLESVIELNLTLTQSAIKYLGL